MKMIHRMTAILLCCILLLTAGCSKAVEEPENKMENVTAETTLPRSGDASLLSLRQAMIETPQLFAVAYFGYHDTIDSDLPADPCGGMQECTPQLCADLPFLTEIPKDQIVGENGDLFCIVPLDENATVSVSKGRWHEVIEQYLYEESLYFSESGEPILVFCNDAGFEPDTQVCISGPSGEVIWYPQIDDNLCVMSLSNDNGDSLFYDFSAYREMLVKDYRDMKDAEWVIPTEEMLTGTTWVWDRFLKDGREVSCQVTFQEDTLSVRWNDGIDEEDHEYPDARWKLTNEDGYSVLSIDFREMAGVLRYNLLYHEVYENLYFGMDVLQEEMPIGWEPLYRFMMEPPAPEPVEMLGDWELAWTEVEGDRNEVAPGVCSISIQMGASSGFLMSYTSREYPHNNFEHELLTFDERELHYGCGNDAWVADLDYVGPWNTTYAFTLTVDDILIKQNYYLVDGAPAVSYEYFRRVGE